MTGVVNMGRVTGLLLVGWHAVVWFVFLMMYMAGVTAMTCVF